MVAEGDIILAALPQSLPEFQVTGLKVASVFRLHPPGGLALRTHEEAVGGPFVRLRANAANPIVILSNSKRLPYD